MGEGVGKYSISYKEDTAFGATIVKKNGDKQTEKTTKNIFIRFNKLGRRGPSG